MTRRFQFSLSRMFWVLFVSAVISAIALIVKLYLDVEQADKELFDWVI